MATSRKRERELARRRFERRRQLQLERRARLKRRNTILGSTLGTAIVLAVVIVLIVHFAGGSSSPKRAPAATTPTASTSPSSTPAAPTKCAKISPNPPAKGQPRVPDVRGKAPNKLVVKDVKVGHGQAAKDGDSLGVTYIGVGCSTGKVFDASYLHPPVKPFTVAPLGQASVIEGWNKGLVGIKPGGVRELIIPASLGYGAQGSGAIKPNETLIFLVTAKTVTAGK